ncbi:MAG: corrinoid protein [Oscillospiraceae bacterium]
MNNGIPYLRAISDAITDGRPKQVEKTVRDAIEQHVSATDMLYKGMIPAIKTVGEKFKNNEIYIPRILASARAMSFGLNMLQPYFESGELRKLGTVILGTAEGDLHDVGKNLVGLMLKSAGFKVVDLGVDNSVKKFITAVEKNPDTVIVCVSSLLSTSMPEMCRTVEALNHLKSSRNIKIMVGGAPITAEYAAKIGADAYTENAVEAAEIARAFADEIQKPTEQTDAESIG